MDFPVQRSLDEWRQMLDPEQFAVLRQAATETPFSGSLLALDDDGVYRCAGCGQRLFASERKFDAGCGWPSFDRCEDGSILERRDTSLGRERTEIVCASCGGHLGHVFDDGPTDTGLRYCVNSLALNFEPESPAS